MLARTRNCCLFHLNANAKPNQARPAPLDPRVPTDHPEMLVVQAAMVLQARKDQPVQPVQLAPTVTMVLAVHLARKVL